MCSSDNVSYIKVHFCICKNELTKTGWHICYLFTEKSVLYCICGSQEISAQVYSTSQRSRDTRHPTEYRSVLINKIALIVYYTKIAAAYLRAPDYPVSANTKLAVVVRTYSVSHLSLVTHPHVTVSQLFL